MNAKRGMAVKGILLSVNFFLRPFFGVIVCGGTLRKDIILKIRN